MKAIHQGEFALARAEWLALDRQMGQATEVVGDRLRALAELHQERSEEWDWTTTFASSEGAQLVREAAQAERQGVACLRQIAGAL